MLDDRNIVVCGCANYLSHVRDKCGGDYVQDVKLSGEDEVAHEAPDNPEQSDAFLQGVKHAEANVYYWLLSLEHLNGLTGDPALDRAVLSVLASWVREGKHRNAQVPDWAFGQIEGDDK